MGYQLSVEDARGRLKRTSYVDRILLWWFFEATAQSEGVSITYEEQLRTQYGITPTNWREYIRLLNRGGWYKVIPGGDGPRIRKWNRELVLTLSDLGLTEHDTKPRKLKIESFST